MIELADEQLATLRELRRLWDNQRRQIETLEKEQERIGNLLQALSPRPTASSKSSRQALIVAIESRNSPKVQQLLKEGADPNIRTGDGETILQLAVSSVGNEKIVRALLNVGAEVDARDSEGNTPLIVCVDDDRIKTAQLLIDHGADVEAKNADGDTPLSNAACWGSAKCVALLLKHRANPRVADGQGLTALSLAEQHRHTSIAKMLIKAIDALAVG